MVVELVSYDMPSRKLYRKIRISMLLLHFTTVTRFGTLRTG